MLFETIAWLDLDGHLFPPSISPLLLILPGEPVVCASLTSLACTRIGGNPDAPFRGLGGRFTQYYYCYYDEYILNKSLFQLNDFIVIFFAMDIVTHSIS